MSENRCCTEKNVKFLFASKEPFSLGYSIGSICHIRVNEPDEGVEILTDQFVPSSIGKFNKLIDFSTN